MNTIKKLANETKNGANFVNPVAIGGSGSGNGVLIVEQIEEYVPEEENPVYKLNHTWQEIHDAMASGGAIIRSSGEEAEDYFDFYNYIYSIGYDSIGGYYVMGFTYNEITTSVNSVSYHTMEADGYPTYDAGGQGPG